MNTLTYLHKYQFGKIISYFIIILLGITSCRPKFYEAPAPTAANAGSADFRKYVAVGSSISAGFADNALYTEAQENSYPNLLAKKFAEAQRDIVFIQPNINSANGWSSESNGRSLLTIPSCVSVAIGGVAQPGESGIVNFTGDKNTITNLSVPFIPIANINSNTVASGTKSTNAKPYFDRIVSPSSLGIASEAKRRGASFFTVWLGYEDLVNYATSGGTTNLLSVDVFTTNINAVLDSLLSVPNAKGVIANIPYVDLFPIVTNNNRRLTSSNDPARNPVRLTATKADEFNAALGITSFSGKTGNANNFAIQTSSGIRQLETSKDFIVASRVLDSVGIGFRDAQSLRNCKPDSSQREQVGFVKPILNYAVLDKDEVKKLRTQIDLLNQVIAQAVQSRNTGGTRLAIVDLNAFYTALTDPLRGIAYGSEIIRANHPSLGPDFGGFYSLDRFHPTPKGHALLANEFLKAINISFGSNFSVLNPDNFRGNIIP